MTARIEPTITHGIARDLPRCPLALEVSLPDAGDGYENASLILQCEREAGHPGQHRYHQPITWTTPRGDDQ